MQLRKKEERRVLLNSFYSLIPEIVISLIFHVATDGELNFFLVLIGLQIIYFLIWLKDVAWSWIFYNWKGKKQTSEKFFEVLKRHNFPINDVLYDETTEYLSWVVADDETTEEQKIVAAQVLGELSAYKLIRMRQFMQVNFAMDDALTKYCQEDIKREDSFA